MGTNYQRALQGEIEASLKDSRVTLLQGPRQAGKTTLAKQVAGQNFAYLSLDKEPVYRAAKEDPEGFVQAQDRAIIDEVQRVPELLRAIKVSVDNDPRPGRFLLTGSAHLLTLPTVSESLAGRMEILELLPLAQCEMRGGQNTFLAEAFAGRRPQPQPKPKPQPQPNLQPKVQVAGQDLVEKVFAGGFPEAVARRGARSRQRWFTSYITALMQRDIYDIAETGRSLEMRKLLERLAASSAQLVNFSELGSAIEMSRPTTQKYVRIMEQMYLIKFLRPWYKSGLTRLVKTPRLHFVDSGLLAALRQMDVQSVAHNATGFGPVLESFVVSEVAKLASLCTYPPRMYYYRDKDKVEVDLVLEGPGGAIVGIEVKKGATVADADFTGLRRLRNACGDKFKMGMVLCATQQSLPYGDRLAIVPHSALF